MTATVKKRPADAKTLLRRAALAGPGYRGRRESLDRLGRNDLARAILDAKLTVPAYLDGGIAWRNRSAKLFQAGDYPDKGVCIDSDQLKSIANGFDLPVPILIEHSDSPLQIGFLIDVVADGNDLLGTLALSEEAEKLIDSSGAHALSIGLSSNLEEIREVSLVRNPRVADARIFGDTIQFFGKLEASESIRSEISAQIEHYVRQGKITVAQAPIAQEILTRTMNLQFHEEAGIALLFTQFLERQPRHRLSTEIARMQVRDYSNHLLLPEEVDFYRKHFPDIDLSEIARSKSAS